MADHLEIEQKFDADPDFERPDFAGVTTGVAAAAPVLHRLSATYFDTAGGRLQAGDQLIPAQQVISPRAIVDVALPAIHLVHAAGCLDWPRGVRAELGGKR